uniref:Uncharacterized protein n=1 Tax=Arundo donax TaxID=35708 RepID=A0A0A9GNV8_ARUDO
MQGHINFQGTFSLKFGTTKFKYFLLYMIWVLDL